MEVLTVDRKCFKAYLTTMDGVYNLVLKEYSEKLIKSIRMVYNINCNQEALRFMCYAFCEEDSEGIEVLASLLKDFKIGKTELISIPNFNLQANYKNVEH